MRSSLVGRCMAVLTLAASLVAVAPRTAQALNEPAVFKPLGPIRLLDTRNGTGAPTGVVPPNGTVTFPVSGRGGVPPAGATAVALNLTVTASVEKGFVQVFPTKQASIGASSNLNIERPDQTIASMVVTPIGDGGQVSVFLQGGGHVLADVFGYWFPSGPAAAGRIQPVKPIRLLDTRTGHGLATNPGDTMNCGDFPNWAAANDYFWRYQPLFGDVAMLDQNGDLFPCETLPGNPGRAMKTEPWKGGPDRRTEIILPNGNALPNPQAVLVNVTVTEAEQPGFVQLLSGESPATLNGAWSNLNVLTGQTIANSALIPVNSRALSVYHQPRSHVIIDLLGFVTGATAPTSFAGRFVPITPTRLKDTRSGPAPGPGGMVTVVPGGMGTIPTGPLVGGVLLTVTATDAAAPGFVQVVPTGEPTGMTSTLNVERAGQTIANSAITGLNQGSFTLFTQSGSHLIADTAGYLTGEILSG